MSCVAIQFASRTVDLDRMSLISGRDTDRIQRLSERAQKARMLTLPINISSISSVSEAKNLFLSCRPQRKARKSHLLMRWIQLAQFESDLVDIRPHVRSDTEMELFFLQKVARICPGE